MTAPVPLTYNAYVTQIALMAVVDVSTVAGVVTGDANFQNLIPQMLNYAELRIARDLNLLMAHASKDYAMQVGNPLLDIPTADFVVVETLTGNYNGELTPIVPVSIAFIQSAYANITGDPQFFAPYGGDADTFGLTSNIFLLGPAPDNAYPVTATGLMRAPSLNTYNSAPAASSQTTFISTYLPDLLVQASMIYVSEYQRNFGKAADDPQMAMTYETAYETLLAPALLENYRARFQADAWSAEAKSPAASPVRQGG